MARYRRIDVRIHFDQRVERLSPIPPCGEGLWHYLLTNPDGTMIPGLARCGRAAMAEALGWDQKAFDKAFGEVFREGLAEADWKARVVWVPNVIRYDPPGNPNVVRGWAPHWDEIPDCALKAAAWDGLQRWFVEDARVKSLNPKVHNPKAFLEAFLEACPKPSLKPSAKPSRMRALRIPEIRIQEQEENTKSARAAPAPAREGRAVGQKTGAPPPDPRVARASKANGAESIPGEEQLEALADALWTAHPSGVRGGTRVATQRALLALLTAGRIWPDESPPDPSPPAGFGLSFSELRARHEAWLAVWRPRGTVPPMNLPRRWLGRDGDGGGLDFLDLPPAQEGRESGGGIRAQAATRRRWGSDLAPGTTREDVERAKAFDLEVFGPREG